MSAPKPGGAASASAAHPITYTLPVFSLVHSAMGPRLLPSTSDCLPLTRLLPRPTLGRLAVAVGLSKLPGEDGPLCPVALGAAGPPARHSSPVGFQEQLLACPKGRPRRWPAATCPAPRAGEHTTSATAPASFGVDMGLRGQRRVSKAPHFHSIGRPPHRCWKYWARFQELLSGFLPGPTSEPRMA